MISRMYTDKTRNENDVYWELFLGFCSDHNSLPKAPSTLQQTKQAIPQDPGAHLGLEIVSLTSFSCSPTHSITVDASGMVLRVRLTCSPAREAP